MIRRSHQPVFLTRNLLKMPWGVIVGLGGSKDCIYSQLFESTTRRCENQGVKPSSQSMKHRLTDFKLAAFDMDSTLINIECVDEIADAAGRKAEVAAITQAAMLGEITDYKDSLRRRVALLRGVPVAALQDVLTQRLRLNPGARELTAALSASGCKLLLVSGGFSFFTSHVKQQLRMDFVRSNVLGIDAASQTLSGALVDQAWGDICDGAQKRRTLLELASLMGIGLDACMAVGDGANDLPMMLACSQNGGLSVAYHAKPAVQAQAMLTINSGGLDQVLTALAS